MLICCMVHSGDTCAAGLLDAVVPPLLWGSLGIQRLSGCVCMWALDREGSDGWGEWPMAGGVVKPEAKSRVLDLS